MPMLRPFELGYATDTKRLYIGSGVGNILLSNALSDRKSVVRTSIDIELDETHYAVFTDAAAAHIAVFLPAALTNQGQIYIVKQVIGNKRTNVIPSGTDIIEGASSVQIRRAESVTIIAEGAGWWII